MRYLVDNHVYNLSDALPEKINDPWIIVDRVELDTTDTAQLDRISQSLSTAFEHGEDVVGIYRFPQEGTNHNLPSTNKKEKQKKSIIED